MLILAAFLCPVILGIAASLYRFSSDTARNRCCAAIMLLSDILCVLAMIYGEKITLFHLTETVTMSFEADRFGRLALAVVMLVFTAVCFYAFEYMKMEERQNVFFAFFFVAFGAMVSVCLAGNLVTMYFCFELATLSTVPLVLHERTKEAVAAGLKYLFYSIAGALLGLFAIFFVYYFSGAENGFVMGGFLDLTRLKGHETVFLIAIFCGIIGFGTKAGMYPMHGWLPTAHPIAPAPASALLSGIIAKAGIIAVIRLVYYSVGTFILAGTWVQYTWMILAMLTVFMGSMMAFREKIMKKRLAYSTVSQISYIMLALSLLSADCLNGGLLHLMSHAASKGCLFMVAGIFIYKLGKRRVDELKGVGKQMPVTMWCFMIAALSLVGIPPMGGFLSKWVIAGAALKQTGAGGLMGVLSLLGPIILLISALLTAGYLFPVAVDAFFPGKDFEEASVKKCEPSALMLVPMILLCAAALVVGVWGRSILGLLGI